MSEQSFQDWADAGSGPSPHAKKYLTIPDYLDKIAEVWEAEHVRERGELYHPEDALGQIIPFANAFLLGWSVALRNE